MDPALIEQIPEHLRSKVSAEFARLQTHVRLLEELLRQARIDKFGRSSERLSDGQLELLEAEPSVRPEEIETEAAIADQEKTPVSSGQPRPTKPVRQPLPAELPRKERVIACKQADCRCGQCGGEKKVIGYEVSEALDIEPARYFVLVTKREKRACPQCEEMGVAVAPVPEKIVEKGLGTDALVVDIVIKKYVDHLPLYRQSAQIERDCGLELSRTTLCGWIMRVGDLLMPVNRSMGEDLLLGGYIQADETPVPVQSPKTEGRNHQAYLWQYSRPGGPVHYDFRMGREREGPRAFLKNYNGILQTDGYGAYDKVGGPKLVHAACWAHARRKFFDALQVDPKDAFAAAILKKIGELYDVEREAREGGLDAAAREALRKEKSVALLAELKALILQAKASALPKSALGKACNYAFGLWGKLERYIGTGHGRIEIDSNWCENAMRPITLGRKNWLHIGSEEAGPRVAAIASIVETCKRLGINVRHYMEEVLPRIANWPARRIAELTPMAWLDARGKSAQ